MKKIALTLGTALILVVGGFSVVSCGESAETAPKTEEKAAEKTEEAHAHKHYQCPMDCEKGKVYEAEGSCPVCKMDLKEVKA